MPQLNPTIHAVSNIITKILKSGSCTNELTSSETNILKDFIEDNNQGNRQYITWTTEDIIGCGVDRGIKISKSNAVEILSELVAGYNPELGISWDTVDVYIDNFFNSTR